MDQREELACVVQAVGEMTRTMQQMSDVIDLLFGFIAKHASPEELETIAENVKKGKEA